MLVSRNDIYDFIRKFDCGVMLVCVFNRPCNFVSSQSETTSFNFCLDTCLFYLVFSVTRLRWYFFNNEEMKQCMVCKCNYE